MLPVAVPVPGWSVPVPGGVDGCLARCQQLSAPGALCAAVCLARDPSAPPPPVPLAWIGETPVYFEFPTPPGYAYLAPDKRRRRHGGRRSPGRTQ